MRSNDVLDGGVRVTDPRLPVEERVHEGPVEALIHAIQVATRAAGGGKATALSKEEILVDFVLLALQFDRCRHITLTLMTALTGVCLSLEKAVFLE